MESDESIDLADSEVVNAYGSVVAKEDHEKSDIFPYFSLKNTNFYWKIFHLYLESSSASRN